MLCGYLKTIGNRTFPCGQCMPCRINKKRMWTARIMLEARHSHSPGTFLTMTYNDEHLPKDGSISVREVQRYINRLRHKSNLGSFRYFAVGEYGDQTERPHYHMAIFNAPPEVWEEKFQQLWTRDKSPMGFTKAGELNQATASYIAGYCTKKMTSAWDERLDGKNPEFALMSKKPPLGYQGMLHIEELLYTRTGCAALAEHGDVPSTFRMDNKSWPIGAYWRHWLRNRIGLEKPPQREPWDIDTDLKAIENEQANKIAVKLWKTQGYKQSSRRL